MDYSKLKDEALLSLVARAHTDALSELYDRYNRLVFSLALNSVGDRGAAEEITQDVFVSVWQKAATYRADQGKATTWLTSVARHRSIDVLRRRNVRPEQHSVEWAKLASGAIPRADGPEETVVLSIRRQRVHAAVAQLPEEQKQILTLAYFGGYSHRQIAEMLDQPLETVKPRIRLAMQQLRLRKRETRYVKIQGVSDRRKFAAD
jgi:RNA polymerase sigma-70 factor (ECF subfamily)